MFIVRMIRYIRGYVRFVVTGGFTERFFNLCAQSGVKVWGVRPRNDHEAEGHTLGRNYRKMRPLAKRSGVRLRVDKKVGAPFVVHRYRRRWGLVAASVLFVVMLWGMSGFIWSIEIVSPVDIPHEQIRAELSEIGIREGVWRGSINAREASRRMMLLNDDIAWIALNIVGSSIYVEINPRTMPPDHIDYEKTPTNVIASHTGQIKYMEVYDGQSVLTVGDTVMKGEVIVSGITEDKWGNTMLKHARAVVKAWTNEHIDVSVPLGYDEKVYIGEAVKRHSVSLFGFEIPLNFAKLPLQYDEDVSRHNVRLMGRALPFTSIVRQVRAYEYVPVELNEAQARERAVNELERLEKSRFGEGGVVERSAVGVFEDGAFTIKADYTVERDIAVVTEIFIESGGSAQ